MSAVRKFFEKEMLVTESLVLEIIEICRLGLEKETPRMEWHFIFTQDVRDYLVFHIVDYVLGFAQFHGQLTKVIHDPRFQNCVRFIVSEEEECFTTANSESSYLHKLTDRTLRLLLSDNFLAALIGTPAEVLAGPIFPHPIDILTQHFPLMDCDISRPGADDTGTILTKLSVDCALELLQTKVERARQGTPKLAGIRWWRRDKNPSTAWLLQLRLSRFAMSVSAIVDRCQKWQPREARQFVVVLFGCPLFFVVKGQRAEVIAAFQAVQARETERVGVARGTVGALRLCPQFLPKLRQLIPDSLYSFIAAQFELERGGTDAAEGQGGNEPTEGAHMLVHGQHLGLPAGGERRTAAHKSKPDIPHSREAKTIVDSIISNLTSSAFNLAECAQALEDELILGDPEVHPDAVTVGVARAGPSKNSAENVDSRKNPVQISITKIIQTAVVGEKLDSDRLHATEDVTMTAEELEMQTKEYLSAIEKTRYCFTVKSAGEVIKYECPVLGYLPLLPGLKKIMVSESETAERNT